MKKYKIIVGVDVSKLKLDACVFDVDSSKVLNYQVIKNCKKNIEEFLEQIQKLSCNPDEIFICFEETGIYGSHLCYQLSAQEYDFAVVSALEIKRSSGLIRGKSDKADARTIAKYAAKNLQKLRLYKLPTTDLQKLRLLLSEREKIVKAIAMFESTEEQKDFLPVEVWNEVKSNNSKTLNCLNKQLIEIEKRLKQVVKHSATILKQYQLLTSITGIGPQTALHLILFTKSFTAFKEWRQFACYVGTAPFEYSSGTSIRGRTRVSHYAQKKLKSLINMAALTAKKHDKELTGILKEK